MGHCDRISDEHTDKTEGGKTKAVNTQEANQRQVNLIRTITREGKQDKDKRWYEITREDEPYQINQDTITLKEIKEKQPEEKREFDSVVTLIVTLRTVPRLVL